MVFKIVFQVPYDEACWDEQLASNLRRVTPGDPHGPHIKIYVDERDPETGEPCARIRCKHHSLSEVERLAASVRAVLPALLGLEEDHT